MLFEVVDKRSFTSKDSNSKANEKNAVELIISQTSGVLDFLILNYYII